MKVDSLLRQTGMWRASSLGCEFPRGTPTGFDDLDRCLAGGGWPKAGITEILFDGPGIGEMRLLMPALSRLSHEHSRWVLLVSPPHLPYPLALANAGLDLSRLLIAKPKTREDALWTLEKALGSKSCSAVLAWPRTLKEREIRRLQVAAREGDTAGFLMRPGGVAGHASPAELRLRLHGMVNSPMQDHCCVSVEVIKRRGGWPADPMTIHFTDGLNRMTPNYSELTAGAADREPEEMHPRGAPSRLHVLHQHRQ